MRAGRWLLPAILIMLTAPLRWAAAQEVAEAGPPAWLLLEQGKQAFHNRDYGEALSLFRNAVAVGGETPEADMWIGRVFEEEGEVALAVDQYTRALSKRSQLIVPDDALSIEYSLARLYLDTNQYGKYEVTLREIVSQDSNFQDPKKEGLRDAMLRILRSSGYDRIMTLYRFYDQRTLKAHSELGVFTYRTGRYREAMLNLAFSSITVLTTLIKEVERYDPGYEFSTTSDLLAQASGQPRLADYLSTVQLYRDFYYMGASLFADGESGRAREIWNLVADNAPATNPWRQRSLLQLKKPFVEPILDIEQ